MTSCDYSPVVINKMKERCSEKMSMKCMVASEVSLVGDVEDIHHMSYPDESFDVVIDKGTLDAIICGDEATCFPDKVLLEVKRVLKKDGVYICITFGMPENRMDYFQKSPLKWKITHIPLRKPH